MRTSAALGLIALLLIGLVIGLWLARSAADLPPPRRDALSNPQPDALSNPGPDAAPMPEPYPEADESAPTLIVFLGTGNPRPEPERSGPSVAVIAGGLPYLVDLGPGIVRRAAEAYEAGIDALAMERLRHAFVTHLHSDHTVGYADLIFTPWVVGRSAPLCVWGPPGIREMTDHLLAAYRADIRVRVDGKQPIDETGFLVRVQEVGPGVILHESHVTVEAFPVLHGAWEHAFGYKFTTGDRTIVISGDARPSESIVEQCDGCDVLVHEVYAEGPFLQLPPEAQAYHRDAHTSTAELADIATRARPGLLILYHQLYWGGTIDDVIEEIRLRYDGPVVSANDLEVY